MNKIIVFSLLFLFLFPLQSLATSGCCSHHDGVCGCSSSGRQTCCDGTLSPSCTCAYTPPKTINTYKPPTTKLIAKENDQWCGAGAFFYSKNEADDSLRKYESKIEEPLKKEIEELNGNINALELKTWVNFFFLLIIYSLSVISMLKISSCEKCNNSTIINLIRAVFILFIIYLFLGGFSYLHP